MNPSICFSSILFLALTASASGGVLFDHATAPWNAMKDAQLRTATAVALTNHAAAAKRLKDRAAGAEAARKIRVFFLDKETAMNPNLNFGQAIPGRCAGRGIGLIDTRFFANRLIDAFAILERTGDLTAEDLAGLKAWFARYLDWMMTSPIGLDEQDEHNNHGTAYDLQAATYAHFVGKDEIARKILENDTKKRIASQIQPDGSQPHELARTRSFTYATMNATLFCELALLGEKVGVDLWRYETADGREDRSFEGQPRDLRT